MEKLPEDFKKKWVAALRSGHYNQADGMLYDRFDNSYCCLGVACVVAGAKPTDNGYIERGTNIKGISKVPKILIGNDDTGVIGTLIHMNDYGSSFSEIADYIEKNL